MAETTVGIGPAAFRIVSAWPKGIAELDRLYAGYPRPAIADFTVRLAPAGPLRRWLRPSVAIRGDHMLPGAAPLPGSQHLLAAEMGMNLQMALGWRHHLLLHASAVERDGAVLLMCGDSGSGKSTLAALLAGRGWRLFGDEFALVDPANGLAHPFPRLVSLKGRAIDAVAAAGGEARFGPLLSDTPKGAIRHLVPDPAHVARMAEAAPPALILFPRFGGAPGLRRVGRAELAMRLTQASTNYVALGAAGHEALVRLIELPAVAIDYDRGEAGLDLVERLWAERGADR
mgnify:CR=1 FL=1